MGLFGKNFRRLLGRLLEDFIIAIVVLILAGIFCYFEGLARSWKMDDYYVVGCHYICVVLFILDGIIIVATALALCIGVVKKASKDSFRVDKDEDENEKKGSDEKGSDEKGNEKK